MNTNHYFYEINDITKKKILSKPVYFPPAIIVNTSHFLGGDKPLVQAYTCSMKLSL